MDLSHLESRRLFDYPRSLLPNGWLARLEEQSKDANSALKFTGLSMGYPAWNLLYYSLFCALPPDQDSVYLVETGTNAGISTIILAQVLKDRKLNSKVQTVDIQRELLEIAVVNVHEAGLSELVDFHLGDSLAFLQTYMGQIPRLDFAFLDGNHETEHVVKEFEAIHPRLTSPYSTVFFDNTKEGGVQQALQQIRERFGGNLIEFPNCSWGPPGNAIWQPSRG